MLSKQNRLTSEKDFNVIKEKGSVVQSDSFAIAFLKRGDEYPSRFGFIVSTKIDKRATIRNRAKRALREGVRHELTFIQNGYDCVILAKPIIVKKYTDELMREVHEILKKAKISK